MPLFDVCAIRGNVFILADDLLNHQQYQNRHQRQYSTVQYIRYALLSGHGLKVQWDEMPDKRQWLLALPKGVGNSPGGQTEKNISPLIHGFAEQ